MLLDDIRKMVQNECSKQENKFGKAFYEQHILVVRDYACRLAEQIGADCEVVELASYLHDISVIQDFTTLIKHAESGSERAEAILKDHAYDCNKIEAVKHCIVTHSKPVQVGDGSPESVCLSNADAMSQIVKPNYWMYYFFSVRGMSFEQGTEWYQQRIKEHEEALIPAAKKMIAEEYHHMEALFLKRAASRK